MSKLAALSFPTQMAPDYDHLTLMEKVEVFENAVNNTAGDDLAKLLWLKSPSSEVRGSAFSDGALSYRQKYHSDLEIHFFFLQDARLAVQFPFDAEKTLYPVSLDVSNYFQKYRKISVIFPEESVFWVLDVVVTQTCPSLLQVWFDRRTNYTRSLAVMSMVGYILGLGDRWVSQPKEHTVTVRPLTLRR